MPEVPLASTFTAPNTRTLGFEDPFDRASGSVGVAPSGQTWQQVSTAGVAQPLVIASNMATRGAGGTAARTMWTLDGSDPDGDVSGRIGLIGDAIIVLAGRVLDADNAITLEARGDATDKKYILKQRLNGVTSTLGSTTGGTLSAVGDIPRMVFDYDKVWAYVNGTALFGGTPKPVPTSLLYSPRHGIMLQNAGTPGLEAWDWVKFIPLGY